MTVALIAGMVGCGGGGGEYDLTIASTAGGSVSTPGEGTFTYDEGTVVNLVATPDAGYHFVNWTGNVGTIANVNAAATTITMHGDYSITANFALGTLIAGVPDTNWPPTNTLASTPPGTSYCAPLAMVNILEYWDVVMGYDNAAGVTAGLPANTVAEYIGYFMNTNDTGSPDRLTKGAGHAGTVDPDIGPGTLEFVRWDAANPFPIGLAPAPPPALPAGKIGYLWAVIPDHHVVGLPFYTAEIDAGRPLVVSFTYWNPIPVGINYTDPESEETIDVFEWGDWVPWSYDPDPPEEWDEGIIGHAVTGVGYILDWDPDGDGNSDDYVIVHDNWPTTPENVAIPWEWDKWNISHAVDPAGVPPAKHDLTISSDLFGSVTTPGEGTFTCDAGAVVNLVATPFAECVFVNWTGDVGTIADVNAASTNITMNGDYTITANFLFTPVIPP
jgi:hypothetical protein